MNNESLDQQEQEYRVLKQSLKGGIRSAQGHTWKRRIVEAIHEHPEAVTGMWVSLLLPVVAMTVSFFMMPMVIGIQTSEWQLGGMHSLEKALFPLIRQIAWTTSAIGLTVCTGILAWAAFFEKKE